MSFVDASTSEIAAMRRGVDQRGVAARIVSLARRLCSECSTVELMTVEAVIMATERTEKTAVMDSA